MAWSSAALSASYLSRLDNELPIIIPYNKASEINTTNSVWGRSSDSDSTDSDYPVTNIFDGYTHTYTTPDSNAAENHWLYLNWDTGITFDSIFLIIDYQSLDKTGAAPTVNFNLYIADNSGFSTNLANIWGGVDVGAFFLKSGISRTLYHAAGYELYHTGTDARQYSNVEYMRFQFTSPSNTIQPVIYYIFIGERLALPRSPIAPYNSLNIDSGVEQYTSPTDIVSTRTNFKNRRKIDLDYSCSDTQYDDETNNMLRELYYRTNNGLKPFVYSDKPNFMAESGTVMSSKTTAGYALNGLYYLDGGINFNNTNACSVDCKLQATEQAGNTLLDGNPYLYSLTGVSVA